MFLEFEVIDMEEIKKLLEELEIEDVNEEFTSASYCYETLII